MIGNTEEQPWAWKDIGLGGIGEGRIEERYGTVSTSCICRI
jgi:hypothetical protein